MHHAVQYDTAQHNSVRFCQDWPYLGNEADAGDSVPVKEGPIGRLTQLLTGQHSRLGVCSRREAWKQCEVFSLRSTPTIHDEKLHHRFLVAHHSQLQYSSELGLKVPQGLWRTVPSKWQRGSVMTTG